MASSPKIDDLRKKFEENPRRYFAPLANEYRKAGDIEQAIAICREYLPQQPGHMSGHIVFGQALYEARQLDEAKTVFETALSLDPENLIALKHLGDISLMAGDTEGAKTWYKRVLEADPRNEETQAQLALLEGAGKPGAAPTPVVPVESLSTAKTESITLSKPAASAAAPTVVMKAIGPPPRPAHPPMAPAAPAAPSSPVPAASTDSPTTEIRLDGLMASEPPATTASTGHVEVPATLVMETPHGVTPVARHDAPATQTLGLETTAMTGSDAPGMDSFSLEGLETTSFSAPPPAPPTPVAELPSLEIDLPVPPPAPAPLVPAASEAGDIDLDFGTPAPPPATPAPVEVPALDIGDFAPPAASTLDVPAITVEPPVAAPPAPEALAEIDLGFAAPTVTPVEPVAAAPAPEMEIEQPAAAPESGPFVTETMAELYLQQGHHDEALRVYRALLDQKPGDSVLRAKVASLEAPPPPSAPAAGSPGPTIREVLLLIAQRRPGYRPEASTNGAPPLPSASPEAPYVPEQAPSGSSRWGADALGALWGNTEPGALDESAALTLATAFGDLTGMESGGAPMLGLASAAASAAGAPAVAVPAPTAPASSFSFDKFFSPRVTAEHATTASGQAQPESKEDVARFTRWLEGLKQQ